MSRGFGRVQLGCLSVILRYEEEAESWPTTFDIAAAIYRMKPDANADRFVTDAEHVAVKRALEGLQRKSLIIGFRAGPAVRNSAAGPLRTERTYRWMTEVGLLRWLQTEAESARTMRLSYPMERAIAIADRARRLGMTVPNDWRRLQRMVPSVAD